MTETIDVKNAEKQVFRFTIFEDGIWPIALTGLIIAAIGTFVLVRFLWEHPGPVQEPVDGR